MTNQLQNQTQTVDMGEPMYNTNENTEMREEPATQSENESAAEDNDVCVVRQYLSEKYEFRNNVVAGKLEFRLRDGLSSAFRQLTFEAENTILLTAMQDLGKIKGLKSNISLIIHSEEVPAYDPVREYLTTLPRWDGQNRVAELFGRLPGISAENIYRCSIWLRSAVAHWLKLDDLHGNDTVPTLIGEQGCGKTVFCRRLLPPSLQKYFLDRMNLSNKFDKDMALTNNMIVVLDEFDQYTTNQQATLKQALSRSTVNARPIYQGAQVVRHRYASFLATTNNPQPLNDPTGSRRYICIRIMPGSIIDNEQAIDYEQLYAQVVEEVCEQKKRYWFQPDEVRQIQIDNVPFQVVLDIDEMVAACFRKPKSNEEGREYSMREIVEIVTQRYPHLQKNMSLKMRLGSSFLNQGFEQRRHNYGNAYIAIPRKVA